MLKLPPPVWTLLYILIAYALTRLVGASPIPGLPIVTLAVILIVAGVALAVSAALLFRRQGTEINPTSASNRALVTSGPFRFTRNPMYLSLVIVALGVAIWIGAWPMFVAPVAVFATTNWVHIPFEEAKMRRQFGLDFDAYCRRIRRWI
jgi:protein-S-isoprenylcysteine O-methyltransferase Ste14